MELMLIVYAVSVLMTFSTVLYAALFSYIGIVAFSGFMWLRSECDGSVGGFIKSHMIYPKMFILGLIMFITIPSEKTIKYMAGAYLVQEIATSETAKEIGDLSTKAVKKQLEIWAADNEQLKQLLEQAK